MLLIMSLRNSIFHCVCHSYLGYRHSPIMASAFIPVHEKKKKKKVEAWEAVRESLLSECVSQAYPASFTCSVCNEQTTNPLRCRDCGSVTVYCLACCDRIHSIALLHRPEMWNPEVMKSIEEKSVARHIAYVQ